MADRVRANRNHIILAGVLLGGLALRLINLGGRNLWYDEAFAVLYGEKSLGAILYGTVTAVEGAAADVHPLLYYFFLHVWMDLFGRSPSVVRLPSVLFGLGTIVLAFLIAQKLFDRRTGLLAVLIAAVAPFHINYSQEARMYSLLCFLSLLSAFFFVRCWRRGGWGNWLGFIVAATLSLYTHNLAFLNLLALDLFVLIARKWRLLKPLTLAHIVVALLFTPWLGVVFSQFGKVQQTYWVPRPGLKELVQTLIFFHFDLLPTMPLWLVSIILFVSLLVLVLTLYRIGRVRGRDQRSREGIYLLLLLAFAPVVVAFLISQFKSIYVIRALLPATIAYYILVAKILAEAQLPAQLPKKVVWLLLSPVVVLLAISLTYHYTYARFPRPPFDKAVAYLRENYQSGDAIVHANKLTFFPCHYYDRELPQTFVADPPGSGSDTLALPTQEALGLFAQEIEAATAGYDRVWLVIFDQAVAEYQAAGYPDHPHLTWLKTHYRLRDVIHFNDLSLYLFQSLAEKSHG
jgi:mannosyltransferase